VKVSVEELRGQFETRLFDAFAALFEAPKPEER
jgi:hypothetical protein